MKLGRVKKRCIFVPVQFGKRHITIMMIVSVAILGASVVMYVFQPETNLGYEQSDVNVNCTVAIETNFPRLD
jgi:hypothetical protein